MKANEFVIEYKKDRKSPKFNIKPRTGHAPTQTGAGPHKDKKKAQKQGDVKHKNKDVTEERQIEEQLDELKRSTVKSYAIKKMEKHKTTPSTDKFNVGKDLEGLKRARERLKGEKPTSEEMSERIRDPEDWDEGNTEPPNNMAIYINGKKWKVFPGRGTYADDEREMKQYYDLQAMCRRKSEATGKKWEVYRTGEPPTA